MEKRVSATNTQNKSNQPKKNYVEAKFKALLKYNKPLYTSAYTIISSCKQALVQTEKEPTPMAYLEALLSVKDNFRKITQIKDEGFIFALSAVLSMVSQGIISRLHDVIYEYIDDVITNSRKNTIVYKYCVVVIQLLLQAKTKDEWKSDEPTLELFIKLFHTCLHSKEAIRRQAIRSFTTICMGKDLSYFSTAMGKLEEVIFKDLDQCLVKVTNRSQNVLNFLSCVLQVLPVSISSNIVKKLLDYTEVDNSQFKKNLYFTIEIMFASTRLSANFVEDFLGFLLNNNPLGANIQSMNNDEELMIVGYCLAVAQVAVHYKKLKGDQILNYLPTVISMLAEYLTVGNMRVQTGAFNAIKNLMQYTLERSYFSNTDFVEQNNIEGLDLDMLNLGAKFNDADETDDLEHKMAEENKKLHPIAKIVRVLQYCLKSRFEPCFIEVLKLTMKLTEIGGKDILKHGGIDLLNNVGNLTINKSVYKTWTKCLGRFMVELGCETFFTQSELRIQLLDYDLTSSSFSVDSRSYLITVIKDHVKNESLSFYVENFLPLISELSKALKVVKKDKEFIKYKKYETLIYQIYEILPNFCSNSYKFGECVPKILPKLERLVQNNTYQARPIALRALCDLIDYAKKVPKTDLDVKKGRIHLMKKSLDWIQTLSKMYINSENASIDVVVKEGEHYILLKAISKLGWICKKSNLQTLFKEELGNILEEFSEIEDDSGKDRMDTDNNNSAKIREKKRQIQLKLDIIICLMERIKLTQKSCSIIIKFADSISKSTMAQKKAFKILSIILKNYDLSTYEELQELFGQLTGYAHNPHQQKQKLVMLKIFLSKIKKNDKNDEEMEEDHKSDDSDEDDEDESGKIVINDEQRSEIISTVLPEIISGYSSHQFKSQKLAESLLMDIVKIFANHFNEFLKKLLAGLAGGVAETRAATIQILTKILKTNPKDFSEANLTKICNIVTLFMKEKSAYVQRNVLKLLKRTIAMMSAERLEPLCSKIINGIVNCDAKKKLNLRIKYVINSCIKKLGKDKVKGFAPEEHHALIDYCFKMKKREENQQKQLITQLQEHRDMLEQENDKNRLKEGERESVHSDSDQESDSGSDDEEEDDGPNDKNIDKYNDIPMVRNLKVVNENPEDEVEEDDDEAKNKKKAKRDAQIDKMMEVKDDEFNTHFNDNPILMVKKRQEQRRKLLEKKLREKDTPDDEDDLYYESKSRKFFVKDVEKVEREVKKAEKRKREQRDEFLDKMLPKEMKHLIDVEDQVKKGMKHKRVKDNEFDMDVDNEAIQLPGRTNKRGKDRKGDGHIIKKSADYFKSKDGKSDVIKKGEHEPYAYIKLNPQMMNKRNRDKAVKSFSTVVTKKKVDKRKTKKV